MTKLYEHQQEAFDRFKNENEICLFFEMGCGKTLTSLKIAEYKFQQGEIDSLLIIAPNDVHYQWFKDIVNPSEGSITLLDIPFEAQCIGGRKGKKQLIPFDDDNKLHIVTVNIDTFSTPTKWKDIVTWSNESKCMIIIDEATVIKNPTSKRAQRILYEFNTVIRRGKTVISSNKINPVRAVLTGTPVTNGPMDLWSIMEFVKPNFFNRNYYSFKEYFGMFTRLAVNTAAGSRDIPVLLTEKTWQGIKNCSSYLEAAAIFGCSEDTFMTIKHQRTFVGPYKHADELKQKLNTVAVFKKLTDCVDMPEQIYLTREVSLSPAQEACYNSMKDQLLAQYGEYTTTAANKLTVNMRLSQISSGFIMGSKGLTNEFNFDEFNYDDEQFDILPDEVVWLDNVPKLDALMRDVAELDKPLIIMTRFTAEAAKIYELCKDQYSTCLITGWKTVGSIDEFKEGKYEVMVANCVKVHRGFNLQNAHTILFYSNTFSMEIRQQAEFRTFRIGQEHSCMYVDYVASQADKTVITALKLKKNLLDYIREQNIKELV